MRWYLIDVDDVSPAMAPEIPFMSLELRRYFDKEDGMMQHNYGRYLPQL